MPNELDDLLEQLDSLLRLQAAIKERLSTATEQEKLHVEASSKRAINLSVHSTENIGTSCTSCCFSQTLLVGVSKSGNGYIV